MQWKSTPVYNLKHVFKEVGNYNSEKVTKPTI